MSLPINYSNTTLMLRKGLWIHPIGWTCLTSAWQSTKGWFWLNLAFNSGRNWFKLGVKLGHQIRELRTHWASLQLDGPQTRLALQQKLEVSLIIQFSPLFWGTGNLDGLPYFLSQVIELSHWAKALSQAIKPGNRAKLGGIKVHSRSSQAPR